MIIGYVVNENHMTGKEINPANASLLKEALWIDLISPTKEEEALVEASVNFDIPTREEMQEIEPSSRLYKENLELFLTATMLADSDSDRPKSDAVTFILMETKLITIRYIEPQAFTSFINRLPRFNPIEFSVDGIFSGLLESAIDRLADILENVIHQLDDVSQLILHPTGTQTLDYKKLLQTIGTNGDLSAKVRESLLSFNRLTIYFLQNAGKKLDIASASSFEVITKDIGALSDHASFISTKVNFLLDATLGMVNIEQNNIIKIFSVAAVIFLPPTLIASIYGMNFTMMPELNWKIGYPVALVLMMVSAWLPYMYFKRRKWL